MGIACVQRPETGRRRFPRLPVLLALLLPTGCGYTNEQACADLASAVWPWGEVRSTSIQTVPLPEQSQVFPAYAIQVDGTVRHPDLFPEPTPATFQCVHSGPALVNFGWIAPPGLSRGGGTGTGVPRS